MKKTTFLSLLFTLLWMACTPNPSAETNQETLRTVAVSKSTATVDVSLNGANDVLSGNPAVELAISIDELPAALNSSSNVVAFVDKETGQWTPGSIALAPEVVENVEQATATPEETFAEPTMDNVEFHERWTRDQFPLQPSLLDGPVSFNLDCINDEIIIGTVEIMGPNGEGTGIYLLGGAECWYKEPGQDYGVLVPLVLTDYQQMVIAGHGIQDYDPDYEVFMDTEKEWNGFLEDRGFTGRGHIFSVLITTPRHDKGTNQGLANEELGLVYTQGLVEQFANGNGDPKMLPFVVIDSVKYYVLPPFNIGMKSTLNI